MSEVGTDSEVSSFVTPPDRRQSPVQLDIRLPGHMNDESGSGRPTPPAGERMVVPFMVPGGRRLIMQLHMHLNMHEVLTLVAAELGYDDPDKLEIYLGSEPVPDSLALAGLDLDQPGFVLNVLERLLPKRPDWAAVPNVQTHIRTNAILVQTGSGENQRTVTVHLERDEGHKPFLGGYRDKGSGTEFLNASAQTYLRPYFSHAVLEERDAQTAWGQPAAVQTISDTCTQMAKPGFWADHRQEKILEYSGSYQTADELWEFRHQKATLLQSYWRMWLAKRRVAEMKRVRDHVQQWLLDDAERRNQARQKRRAGLVERKMDPKNKNDFDVLYSSLEAWRKKAIAYCYATKSGGELKAALCQLLEQEAEMLKAIQGHQNKAAADAKAKRVNRLLEKTQAPMRWPAGRSQQPIEVDNCVTLWARQLRDIHTSLTCPGLTVSERTDILSTLVNLIGGVPFSAGNHELRDLCKREMELLWRGVAVRHLAGLRHRQLQLLSRLVRDPSFNPASAQYQQVPLEAETIRGDVNTCLACNRSLPRHQFQVNAGDVKLRRCRMCDNLENWALRRQDNNVLGKMLTELRRDEQRRSPAAAAITIIQESDFRHLVLSLWDGQSCLSAEPDLYELLLCRWDVALPWTPWNCVLLTRDESEAHYKLARPSERYGAEFCQRVHLRHVAARRYFCHLPAMMTRLEEEILERGLGGKKPCHQPTAV